MARYGKTRRGGDEFVIEDFSGGSNLVETEWKSGHFMRGTLMMRNLVPTSNGDLVKRQVWSPVLNSRGDDMHSVFYVEYYTASGGRHEVSVDSDGDVWTIDRADTRQTIRRVYRWGALAGPISSTVLYDRLYLATRGKLVIEVEQDGTVREVSSLWDEGYEYPSVVQAYGGRIAATGFSAPNSAVTSAEIRFTPLDTVDELIEDSFIVKSVMNESPTALIPLTSRTNESETLGTFIRDGLILATDSTMSLLLGTDFVDFSDIELIPYSRTVGCYGPKTWCATPAGIAVCGRRGVFIVTGPGVPQEASRPLAPMFGSLPSGYAEYDLISHGRAEFGSAVYDPVEQTMLFLLPTTKTGSPSFQSTECRKWVILCMGAGGTWSVWDGLASYGAAEELYMDVDVAKPFLSYDQRDGFVTMHATFTTQFSQEGVQAPLVGTGPFTFRGAAKYTDTYNSGTGLWVNGGVLLFKVAAELTLGLQSYGDSYPAKRAVKFLIELTADYSAVTCTCEVDGVQVDTEAVALEQADSLYGTAKFYKAEVADYKYCNVPRQVVQYTLPETAKGSLVRFVLAHSLSNVFRLHSVRTRFAGGYR